MEELIDEAITGFFTAASSSRQTLLSKLDQIAQEVQALKKQSAEASEQLRQLTLLQEAGNAKLEAIAKRITQIEEVSSKENKNDKDSRDLLWWKEKIKGERIAVAVLSDDQMSRLLGKLFQEYALTPYGAFVFKAIIPCLTGKAEEPNWSVKTPIIKLWTREAIDIKALLGNWFPLDSTLKIFFVDQPNSDGPSLRCQPYAIIRREHQSVTRKLPFTLRIIPSLKFPNQIFLQEMVSYDFQTHLPVYHEPLAKVAPLVTHKLIQMEGYVDADYAVWSRDEQKYIMHECVQKDGLEQQEIGFKLLLSFSNRTGGSIKLELNP
jgi:hypothetical protein